MKKMLLLAAAATLGTTACGNNADGEIEAPDAPVEAVEAPDGGDWSEMVVKTGEGGYLMGNPEAPVKLIEYASMTCPHCARFDVEGAEPLVDNYVKSGRVSYEFRNYVMNQVDMTASMIARCGADQTFFPLTHAMFESQAQWASQAQSYIQANAAAIQSMSPEDAFAAIADGSGLKTFAVQRGVPAAQVDACLADPDNASRLVEMNGVAVSDHDLTGTPTFIINGTTVRNASQWDTLEPILKTALGEE